MDTVLLPLSAVATRPPSGLKATALGFAPVASGDPGTSLNVCGPTV